MNWMAAPGQRPWAPCAMANERAYSPMPNAPETGTNKRRGARSFKGGEPAIEHQHIPCPAKLGAHRAAQHAARHETRHGFLQNLGVAFQPAMYRQAKA